MFVYGNTMTNVTFTFQMIHTNIYRMMMNTIQVKIFIHFYSTTIHYYYTKQLEITKQ